MEAPYLDKYGECDKGLHRGIPLKFNSEMYENLQSQWEKLGIASKVFDMQSQASEEEEEEDINDMNIFQIVDF